MAVKNNYVGFEVKPKGTLEAPKCTVTFEKGQARILSYSHVWTLNFDV